MQVEIQRFSKFRYLFLILNQSFTFWSLIFAPWANDGLFTTVTAPSKTSSFWTDTCLYSCVCCRKRERSSHSLERCTSPFPPHTSNTEGTASRQTKSLSEILMSKIKPEICVIKIKSSLFCSAGASCQNRVAKMTMGGPLYLITSSFILCFRKSSPYLSCEGGGETGRANSRDGKWFPLRS